MRQEQSIQAAFVKLSNQTKLEHKIGLKASIEVARLLLNQGLAFSGHREDESSLNKVDESCDISRKEQMAIVLCVMLIERAVVERFIGIIHVHDTSALCLKEAIVNYLATFFEFIFYTGQCYDGASNMQGRLSGLKVLIQQQMGGSFKRMDELRESQAKKFKWHLIWVRLKVKKLRQPGYLKVCQTFEIAFILHLMRDILAITNELNESLQKKEQDIANVILLVKVVKKRLQDLRNEGWDSLIENLLIGVACLNPVDSFSSFDIKNILRMVNYIDDFGENVMVTLRNH
ncbi:hypothetical protein H5410_010163 [Solanum commersonii]|uniref:DUF4371 domain-containing protein n=1 Tax=Solanum commersonii TaxID=4109 RepID=A0A9J6AKK2_SOLCO|nr:hypothetical protein H5410_010163 [Solanum commersonii]